MLTLALLLSLADPAPAPIASTTPAGVAPAVPSGAQHASTALMAKYAGKLVATASTTWPNWPASRLVDGDPATSWFSEKDDAAAHGKKPWVAVKFPEDVTVSKVALLGNREPNWPKGFTIEYGVVELIDATGKVVASKKNEGKNVAADIDFVFKEAVKGVRTVKFTSLMDQGNQTQYDDIALAEVLVE